MNTCLLLKLDVLILLTHKPLPSLMTHLCMPLLVKGLCDSVLLDPVNYMFAGFSVTKDNFWAHNIFQLALGVGIDRGPQLCIW